MVAEGSHGMYKHHLIRRWALFKFNYLFKGKNLDVLLNFES